MTPIPTRTDRDGRRSLATPLTPRDHHHADWMLGGAIVLLMAFAAYRARDFEVSVPAQSVEEDDAPRGDR